MSAGGTAFVRRALRFIERARAGRYPNARWLAEAEEISIPTARRVVTRLRDDFGAPLLYSDADRGWELSRTDWSFPATDLAPRREILALAIALDTGQAISDPGIERALETFRLRLAERLGSAPLDVDELRNSFSSDRTERSVLRDPLVIDVIEATANRRLLRFRYASPWRAEQARSRSVQPLHVRCTDGSAYLLALSAGQRRVFNLSFVDQLEVSDETFAPPKELLERDWSETFGVWRGGEVVDVCVHIGPPSARYFAGQQWHVDQVDSWQGETLVRRFRGHVSPELVRRLLGLGDGLLAVQPEQLSQAVQKAAQALLTHLRR